MAKVKVKSCSKCKNLKLTKRPVYKTITLVDDEGNKQQKNICISKYDEFSKKHKSCSLLLIFKFGVTQCNKYK